MLGLVRVSAAVRQRAHRLPHPHQQRGGDNQRARKDVRMHMRKLGRRARRRYGRHVPLATLGTKRSMPRLG